MDTTRFLFTHSRTRDQVEVKAVDGPSAWKYFMSTPIYRDTRLAVGFPWSVTMFCKKCNERATIYVYCSSKCARSVNAKS